MLLLEVVRGHRRHGAILRRLIRMAGHMEPKFIKALERFTERELFVATHVARSDEKLSIIWDALHMTRRTFETHLNSAYDKIGMRKRSTLTRIMTKAGLA